MACHFVHANGLHLLLNVLSAALIGILFFAKPWRLSEWFVVTAMAASTGLLLLWLDPSLETYDGLSGLLHDLAIYGGIRTGGWLGWTAAALVVAKVAVELALAPGGYPSPLLDSYVAVSGHACGAAAGLLAATLMALRKSGSSPAPPMA